MSQFPYVMHMYTARKLEHRNRSLEKLGRPSGFPPRRNIRRKSHRLLSVHVCRMLSHKVGCMQNFGICVTLELAAIITIPILYAHVRKAFQL